jgi:hypothetical protein
MPRKLYREKVSNSALAPRVDALGREFSTKLQNPMVFVPMEKLGLPSESHPAN